MSGSIERLRERWRTSRVVLRAPRIRIETFGDDAAHALQRTFTARHPRIRVTARKRWGVALARLPESFSDYLAGRPRQAVRTNRRRADAAGYRYVMVRSADYLDDIFEINRSDPVRQGRPMSEDYVDRDTVVRTLTDHPFVHGVVDADGRLVAYAIVIDIGDAAVVSTILGHARALEDGVMYLLLSEVIRASIEIRRADGSPHWLMYDTFWGAKPGLAYFKQRLGFAPYTVEWVWVGDRGTVAAAAGDAPSDG